MPRRTTPTTIVTTAHATRCRTIRPVSPTRAGVRNRGERVIDAIGASGQHGVVTAADRPVTEPPLPVHRVVAFAYDGIQGLDLVGPIDVFHAANALLDADRLAGRRYELAIASPSGRSIATEAGLRIETTALSELAPGEPIDTLLIPGGLGAHRLAGDDATVDAVRDLGARSGRIVTICTGAFVAAAAGLLDGKRVTTHWARAAGLARRHPGLTIEPDPIYIRDGDVWTSAGVTAGIDLALALVEHDHGSEIAQVAARWLVMFLRRPGGQTQYATPVWSERAETPPIRLAQDAIDAEPGGDHRIGLLAERVGMSERHFTRRFTEEIGMSPGQYVAAVRLEAARAALETTDDTVAAVAKRCGFNTSETMRRTFARRLGVSPDQYRQRFRHRQNSPTQLRSSA